MKIDYDEMQVRFQKQDTATLVDLYRQGTLTQEAESVLLGVLTDRGVSVSNLPQPTDQEIATKAPNWQVPNWVIILLLIALVKTLAFWLFRR